MHALSFAANRGSLAGAGAIALVLGLLLAFAAPAAPAPRAASAAAGSVHFAKDGGRAFDRFTRSPSRAQKAFMRRHYSRMVVFSPYFNRRLRWFPRAWAYRDLYGMFPRSQLARRHPEWILRGRSGHKLYVSFNCSSGRCPQFAGDITNPRFRRAWIRGARKIQRRGYRGIYIDDVNMIRRVGSGSGREITPISPRSHRAIGMRAWRRAVSRFTRQIRRAVPRLELVHNVIWFSPHPRDRYSRTEVRSADVIALERGVNDAGLTGGGGKFGLTTFLRYVDWLHSRRRSVMFDEDAPDATRRDYGLAGYLLINDGGDFLASEPGNTPSRWWSGYEVQLGAPGGRRYRSRGLLRRDFANGFVLLNQPGHRTQTVDLGGSYQKPGGRGRVSTVTLGPATGAVLVK